MAGPIPMGPFSMPMYREWVPRMGAQTDPSVALCADGTDVSALGLHLFRCCLADYWHHRSDARRRDVHRNMCSVVGVNMPFPFLFRYKFRFTNRQLLLTSALVIMACNLLALQTTFMPLLCVLSFLAGFFKLCGTFECMSNIQLWMATSRYSSLCFTSSWWAISSCSRGWQE